VSGFRQIDDATKIKTTSRKFLNKEMIHQTHDDHHAIILSLGGH